MKKIFFLFLLVFIILVSFVYSADFDDLTIEIRELTAIEKFLQSVGLFSIQATPTVAKPGEKVKVVLGIAMPLFDLDNLGKSEVRIYRGLDILFERPIDTSDITCSGCSLGITFEFTAPSTDGDYGIVYTLRDKDRLFPIPGTGESTTFSVQSEALSCPKDNCGEWRTILDAGFGEGEVQTQSCSSFQSGSCQQTIRDNYRTVCSDGTIIPDDLVGKCAEGSICGNGITEIGEQCDGQDFCDDSCNIKATETPPPEDVPSSEEKTTTCIVEGNLCQIAETTTFGLPNDDSAISTQCGTGYCADIAGDRNRCETPVCCSSAGSFLPRLGSCSLGTEVELSKCLSYSKRGITQQKIDTAKSSCTGVATTTSTTSTTTGGGIGGVGETGLCSKANGAECTLTNVAGFDDTQPSTECKSGICVDVTGLGGRCGTRTDLTEGVKIEPHPTCVGLGTATEGFDITKLGCQLGDSLGIKGENNCNIGWLIIGALGFIILLALIRK